MGIIDLIVLLTLLFALWNGWSKGVIVQIIGLAGLFLSGWLAFKFGTAIGNHLPLDPDIASIGGFAIVFVVSFLLLAIGARLLRNLFCFAGLGALDKILGIVLCVVKYLMVLSIIFATIDHLNREYQFIEQRTLDNSRTFHPIKNFSELIFPVVDWVRDCLPEEILPEAKK